MSEPAFDISLLPELFTARMRELLSDEYEAFAASYARPLRGALRVNLRKCSDPADIPGLARPVPWAPGCYYYESEARPGRSPLHEAGVYYIQEASAMAVAALSGTRPGERVLDLCAAPGGKATTLAEMAGDCGLIVANEIMPARAKVLSQNVERMGLANTVVTNESPERLAPLFPEFFDRVLVDAPCSGEGMFRREPDALSCWNMDNIALCAERQRSILAAAVSMLRPGGTLIYSTCTFAPEEDEEQVLWLTEKYPELTVADRSEVLANASPASSAASAEGSTNTVSARGAASTDSPVNTADISLLSPALPGYRSRLGGDAAVFRLWPHICGGEGHFVAILKKAGDPPAVDPAARPFLRKPPRVAAPLLAAWKAFAGATLSPDGLQTLAETESSPEGLRVVASAAQPSKGYRPGSPATLPAGTGSLLRKVFVSFGDNLYLSPAPLALDGLRCLRPGLQLGAIQKNRLIPSHALALALRPSDAARCAQLTDEEAAAYISGSELPCSHELSGWCLVCVRGVSLGWGKAVAGRLKNHYPKGLRRPC